MSGIFLKLFLVDSKEKKSKDRTSNTCHTLPHREGRGRGGLFGGPGVVCLILSSLFFVLLSCAPKRVEVPRFEGGLKELLAGREDIRSISSTFSIEFDRDGNTIRGDGVLWLTSDTLDLQVYSLGFLVAEVTSNNGSTTSNPSFDRKRLTMLVDGLRNSFFWWSIKDPEISEEGDAYYISNSWRRLSLNRETMMPVKQVIELEDGLRLDIYYDEPALIDGIWFPSGMRVEFSRYSVNIRVKTLSLNSHRVQGQRQRP